MTIWKDASGLLIPPFATSFATVRSSYNICLRGAAANSNKNKSYQTLILNEDISERRLQQQRSLRAAHLVEETARTQVQACALFHCIAYIYDAF